LECEVIVGILGNYGNAGVIVGILGSYLNVK